MTDDVPGPTETVFEVNNKSVHTWGLLSPYETSAISATVSRRLNVVSLAPRWIAFHFISLKGSSSEHHDRNIGISHPRDINMAIDEKPKNIAAWLPSKRGQLQVGTAPYPTVGKGEIVVNNAAVAINPLDWFKQDCANFAFSWVKYPFTMGSDLAGEVVEVGPEVTRFHVGDRVLGNALALDQRSNRSSEGAFQHYTVLRQHLASPIPDDMPYDKACVVPLGLSTAACALFMRDYLGLRFPKVDGVADDQSDTLVVWGGSTSVGCNAIQLARAAGYRVVSTASPHNHELLQDLGAQQVFDYRSPTVVRDIVAALKGRKCVGAIAIGTGSLHACIDVLAESEGRKFVAQASADLPPEGFPGSMAGMLPFGMKMGYKGVSAKVHAYRKGIDAKFIWGTDLMENDVGPAIYKDFLPEALSSGQFVPAPEPLVVGKGLEHVQKGMNMNKKGVSAKKIVVSL